MFKVVAGTVEGTGSAIAITSVGFKPVAVIVWNQDDPVLGFWLYTMTDDHLALLMDTPALTHETSGGITPGERGFSIGTNSDLNVSAQTLHWLAIGGVAEQS